VGRRLARLAVTLVTLGVAAVPLVVGILTGLQHVRFSGDVGPGSAMIIILVLAYLVWLPATVVAWVWVQDHLGVHYKYTERVRSTKRETRRVWAGMRFLAGRPTFGQGPGPRDRRAGRRPPDRSGPGRGDEPHDGEAPGSGDDRAKGDR
jgi:hypothetical protein